MRKGGETTTEKRARTTITTIWEGSQNRKQGKRKEMKDKRKNGNKKGKRKNRELVRQACTNRLFPSLPLKSCPLPKAKGVPPGTNHSGLFPLKWLIFVVGFSWEINCVEKRHSFLSSFGSYGLDLLLFLSSFDWPIYWPFIHLCSLNYCCDYHPLIKKPKYSSFVVLSCLLAVTHSE